MILNIYCRGRLVHLKHKTNHAQCNVFFSDKGSIKLGNMFLKQICSRINLVLYCFIFFLLSLFMYTGKTEIIFLIDVQYLKILKVRVTDRVLLHSEVLEVISFFPESVQCFQLSVLPLITNSKDLKY